MEVESVPAPTSTSGTERGIYIYSHALQLLCYIIIPIMCTYAVQICIAC